MIVGPSGPPRALVVEAPDESIARRMGGEHGLRVLQAVPAPRGLADVMRIGRSASTFPASLFAIELLALLRAGLNAVEAVQTLALKEEAPDYRGALESLLDQLAKGHSLSQALAAQSVPTLLLASIRSSEATGDLERALERYVQYATQIDTLRKKLVSALLYPSILLGVAACVMAFLLLYVVPRFASVYADIGGELPFFSAVLLGTGQWIGVHRLVSIVVITVLGGGMAFAIASAPLRARALAYADGAPLIGKPLLAFHLARLYRTLGMLQRSGIPLVEALGTAQGLLPAHLRARAALARTRLSEGAGIARVFTLSGLATPLATQLLGVGERTGEMGDMMTRIADFYDESLARTLDRTMRLAEPLIMVFMGLAIGAVVVLMYMPIFELAGSIQ